MTTWIDIDPQGLMRVTQERETGFQDWERSSRSTASSRTLKSSTVGHS